MNGAYDTRAYQRSMALFCLHNNDTPASAGEIAEQMGVLAQHDGHPRALWIGINAPGVAGVLKALQNDGAAELYGYRKNTRNGREEPTWTCIGDRDPNLRMPNPAMFETADDEPAATPDPVAPNHDRYAPLSRSELYALLEVHDAISGAAARFMREISEINARSRARLLAAGIEVPE